MYAEAAGISHSWGNKLAKIAIAISQNAAKVKIAIATSPNSAKRRLTSIRTQDESTITKHQIAIAISPNSAKIRISHQYSGDG